MDNTLKKTVSLLSYGPEKFERFEKRPSSQTQGFLIWQSRRKSMEAYLCVSLNFENMLQFSAALIKHGGALWISYIVCAVVFGIPMITAELVLGHYINNEMKYVWRMCRIGKGIFWNSLISTIGTALLCQMYLPILLHLSFKPHQLAIHQHIIHDLLHPHCYFGKRKTSNSSDVETCPEDEISFLLLDDENKNRKYFYLPIKHIWVPILYLSAICFFMMLIHSKGIRSLEKVTFLFVYVPYLCAVILAILLFTLPDAVRYICEHFALEWSKLQDLSLWFVAFKTMTNGFAFGTLGLLFVSVHSENRDDIMIDVSILFLNIFLNTLFYTITILGLIGVIEYKLAHSSEETNIYDYIFILMKARSGLMGLPPPKWLWRLLFNSYIIGSTFAQLSLMLASVCDAVTSLVPKFRTNKFYVTAVICILSFLLGILIFSTQTLKVPLFDATYVTIGFLQAITVFWIYSYEKLSADFHFLMGYKPSLFYKITWILSPILFLFAIIIGVVLTKDIDVVEHNYLYVSIAHILLYITCGLIEILIAWRKHESLNIFQANKYWAPTDPLLKKSRIIFKSRLITKEHIYRKNLYEQQLVKPADITQQCIVQTL